VTYFLRPGLPSTPPPPPRFWIHQRNNPFIPSEPAGSNHPQKPTDTPRGELPLLVLCLSSPVKLTIKIGHHPSTAPPGRPRGRPWVSPSCTRGHAASHTAVSGFLHVRFKL
jgi:hypothetical protein